MVLPQLVKKMQVEHGACLQTRQILIKNLRLTNEDLSKAAAHRKVMGTPDDFAESIQYYLKNKRPEYDIRDYYGSVYDRLSDGKTGTDPKDRIHTWLAQLER